MTINRPEVMNAVSPEVLGGLHDALDHVEAEGARVCILTGAGGRAFSAGADLAAMLAMTPDEARDQLEQGIGLTKRLEDGPFIPIAAVEGYALGGGTEIVLSCALRYAGRKAKFGLPETTVGIFPGWGGVLRLPRQVPLPVALDVILSGRILDAQEALIAGLVADVSDDALGSAQQAAERLLKAGPDAQALARKVIRDTETLALSDALDRSIAEWMTLMDSPQRAEGHRAFIEKRAPNWELVER